MQNVSNLFCTSVLLIFFQLVGMLIRARKYGLVDFEGEMLYQRQDDNKDVKMLMSMDEIRRRLRATGDPKNCVALVE